jgi:hypothetical protein
VVGQATTTPNRFGKTFDGSIGHWLNEQATCCAISRIGVIDQSAEQR